MPFNDDDSDDDNGSTPTTTGTVPDFSGFAPGRDTLPQLYSAIRAADQESAWEQALRGRDLWEREITSGQWRTFESALNNLGWLSGGTGDNGNGNNTPPTTPPPANNGTSIFGPPQTLDPTLMQFLSRRGVTPGSTTLGPRSIFDMPGTQFDPSQADAGFFR